MELVLAIAHEKNSSWRRGGIRLRPYTLYWKPALNIERIEYLLNGSKFAMIQKTRGAESLPVGTCGGEATWGELKRWGGYDTQKRIEMMRIALRDL